MKTDRFTNGVVLAAALTMGLVLGLNLGDGGTPAYAQLGGGGSYAVEEIQDIHEKSEHHHHEGRTLAIVTPGGALKLVRINWERARGEDDDFPELYAAAAKTYRVEMLEASASLAD